jgi:hypothetical protein
MAGKTTQKVRKIKPNPQGGWELLVTGAAFVQNVDQEPVYVVWSDTDPTGTLVLEDAHILKAEQDDNYVNDFGDTMWIWKQPTKTSFVAITMFP